MASYFPSLRARPYSFETPEVAARYERLARSGRPAVVLTELRQQLSRYYDVSQLDCVPRSKYTPEMLLKPCEKFDQGGKMPAVHWSSLRRAVRRVRSRMRRKVKPVPLSFEEVASRLDLSTNAGLPTLAKKRDVFEYSLERAKRCWDGACPPPAVMFSRGKNLEVARPVFCLPFEWHLVEGRFFYPIQDLLVDSDTPYVAGLPTCSVASKIAKLNWSPYVLAMDYSGFDGSLSSVLIELAFSIIRSMLTLTKEEETVFQRVRCYFVTCPIVAPDLNVYTGRKHGVPSGSMFTQLVDSLANMIIIEYVEDRTHCGVMDYLVLGDDSDIGLEVMPDVSKIVKTAGELGICVNEAKTRVFDTSQACDVEFLGHTYELGLGSRTVEKTLEKLLTPERLKKEIFSESPTERVEYYLERIRAYQEDTSNSAAWRILRRLETALKFPDSSETIISGQSIAWDRHMFASTQTVERDRWDQRRRQYRNEAGRHLLVRPSVYWL